MARPLHHLGPPTTRPAVSAPAPFTGGLTGAPRRDPLWCSPPPSSHSMDADADRMGSAGLFPFPPARGQGAGSSRLRGILHPRPPAGWEVLAKPSRRLFSDDSQRLGPGVLHGGSQANLGTQPRFLSTGHLPGSKRPGLCLSIPRLSIYLTTVPLVPHLSVHPTSICLSTSIC